MTCCDGTHYLLALLFPSASSLVPASLLPAVLALVYPRLVHRHHFTVKKGYCSRCKEFHNASKKMDVWRLPPILAIQLKRFQYTQYSRRKLRNNVHVSETGLRAVVRKRRGGDKRDGERVVGGDEKFAFYGRHGSTDPQVKQEPRVLGVAPPPFVPWYLALSAWSVRRNRVDNTGRTPSEPRLSRHLRTLVLTFTVMCGTLSGIKSIKKSNCFRRSDLPFASASVWCPLHTPPLCWETLPVRLARETVSGERAGS